MFSLLKNQPDFFSNPYRKKIRPWQLSSSENGIRNSKSFTNIADR
jgi:hypothetical protein